MLAPITLKSGGLATAVRHPELRLGPSRVVRDDRAYQGPSDRGERFSVKVELSAEDAEQIRALEARVQEEAARGGHRRPNETWKSNLKDDGSTVATSCAFKVTPRTNFWRQQRQCQCPEDLKFWTMRCLVRAGLLWHMSGQTGVSLEMEDLLLMGSEGPVCPFSPEDDKGA